MLCRPGVKFLEDEVHTVGGVGFAGVKGFGGGFDGRMLDAFGESAIKTFVQEVLDEALRLEHALKTLDTERTVVVLHYAPIADTVVGEPEAIFPFLGCSRLAETIDRFDGGPGRISTATPITAAMPAETRARHRRLQRRGAGAKAERQGLRPDRGLRRCRSAIHQQAAGIPPPKLAGSEMGAAQPALDRLYRGPVDPAGEDFLAQGGKLSGAVA